MVNDDQQHERTRQPEWDEPPVTIGLIGRILDEHPNYSMTSHYDTEGRQFVMLQFPGENDMDGEAPGEFVRMVSELEDDA